MRHVVAGPRLFRRRFLQLALKRAAMDAELPRRIRDIAATVAEHAMDVLPLRAGERGRVEVDGRRLDRTLDAGLGHRSPTVCKAAPSGAASASDGSPMSTRTLAGNATTTRVPSPGADRTHNEPPRCSATAPARKSTRPMPLPGGLV